MRRNDDIRSKLRGIQPAEIEKMEDNLVEKMEGLLM
jgi:hypothetical protein